MAEVENAPTATKQPQTESKPEVESAATETTTTEAPAKTDAAETKPDNGEDKPAETSESKKDERSGDRYAREDRNGRDRRDRNDRNGGHRGRGNYYNNKPRQRSTFDNLPESDDPDEIRKQVEFYFSDANLPQDRYLFDMTRGCRNESVPIKTICSFKRMRHFQPFSAVVKALRDSEVLEVVTVNNDEEVKRRVPLDDSFGTAYDPSRVKVYEDQSMGRSIYAKGFGDEYDSIQTEIEAFFEPYGPVKQVRLRRVDGTGDFKRSVFVEFDNEDLAKQFLELDPKPTWKDNEEPLKIMSKKAYVETKAEEIRNGETRPNESNTRKGYYSRDGNGRGGRGRGRGGDRGGRGRGGGRGRDDRRGDRRDRRDRDDRDDGDDGKRDRDDWKGRREDFQRRRDDDEKAEGKIEPKGEENGNGEKKRDREDDGVAAEDRPTKQSKTAEETAA